MASWRSLTKIAGSGSISQRHGSEDPDPDPHQNVMDPEHRCSLWTLPMSLSNRDVSYLEKINRDVVCRDVSCNVRALPRHFPLQHSQQRARQVSPLQVRKHTLLNTGTVFWRFVLLSSDRGLAFLKCKITLRMPHVRGYLGSNLTTRKLENVLHEAKE